MRKRRREGKGKKERGKCNFISEEFHRKGHRREKSSKRERDRDR